MKGILYLNTDIFQDEMIYQKAFSLISHDRAVKIRQFKTPEPARLSLGAGLLTYIALDKYGIADQINDIEYGEFGKPFLKNSNFYFSLSHSGKYVVCAYSDKVIGADIQKIKETMPKHTKKILSREESFYLNSLEETDRISAFYRLWSRKESLIKRDGRGLRISLCDLSFVRENKIVDQIMFEGELLHFKEIPLGLSEYAFCICEMNAEFPDCIEEITDKFLIKY